MTDWFRGDFNLTTNRLWRLDLPWKTTPLSLNGRMHWSQKQRLTRAARTIATDLARAGQIPPLGRVQIELHYCPRDRRRRDPINLTLLAKALEDGLVDAKVIPDDTPEFSVPTMPVIDEPDSSPGTVRLYLLIREVPSC